MNGIRDHCTMLKKIGKIAKSAYYTTAGLGSKSIAPSLLIVCDYVFEEYANLDAQWR